MKKLVLATLILFLLASCSKDIDINTCKIDNVLKNESQRNQMLFTRLMAIAINNNSCLRDKIKELSQHEKNLFYKEILIKDLLKLKIGEETVKEYLKEIVTETGEDLEIDNYNDFIDNLLTELPLLTVKIPDWLIDTDWDTKETIPWVFSNLYGINRQITGFKGDGSCYTKAKYFEPEHFELVVKNSEDYFLLKDKKFLEYFQHSCMSIDEFVENYCKKWDSDILVKKRDLQSLYAKCVPDYKPSTKSIPDTSTCPRNEGIDNNYVTGFELASPDLIHSMQKLNCIAGEETFDFELDFHYAIRTGEDSIDFNRHFMVPLYGIRYSELINPDGTTKICDIFNDFEGKKLDYMYFISNSTQDWDRNKYGNSIIVMWNEVDILSCVNKKYFEPQPAKYEFSFPYGFVGKDKVPDAKYKFSKKGFYNKEGFILGQNPIPLGYSYSTYCSDLKTEISTGPQALNVFYEITMH